MALGFGAVNNASRLGQPLDFSVAVKLDAGEALAPECVAAEVMAGDSRVPARQVRARLVRNRDAANGLVRVSTSSRMAEPVVTVTLALGCPPRASHRFVSLLDPPSAQRQRLDVAKAEVGSALEREAVLHATANDALVQAAPPGAAVEAPSAAPNADGGSRDQVEALAQSLARLQQEHQATQQALVALQARLREAEERRHTDPALYGLSTLVVLLLGVIAVLLWRQTRARNEEAQWQRDAQALTETGARASDDAQRLSAPGFDEVTMTSMRVVPETSYPEASTPAPLQVREQAQTTTPSATRVRRELTAEELIDLEQQADFFVALGQEESAIDLLMSHVRSSGGTSPVPYLKLLGIYRRRGESEPYERIRERFNRRFNAHAPEWNRDPAEGRTLDAHPEVVARLQAAWATPARAGDLLETLLFRRDAGEGSFDLPAYEEMLFLYALARDMAERESATVAVDLLLPLDSGETPAIMPAEASRAPARQAARELEVDVDLDAPGPAPAGS